MFILQQIPMLINFKFFEMKSSFFLCWSRVSKNKIISFSVFESPLMETIHTRGFRNHCKIENGKKSFSFVLLLSSPSLRKSNIRVSKWPVNSELLFIIKGKPRSHSSSFANGVVKSERKKNFPMNATRNRKIANKAKRNSLCEWRFNVCNLVCVS